jgi:hypothetical protein
VRALKWRVVRAEVIHMASRRRSLCALAVLACLFVPALGGCGSGEAAEAGGSTETTGGVAARLAGQFTGAGSEAELKEFVDRETTGEERQELQEELAGEEQSEQRQQQAEQNAEPGQEPGEADQLASESAQEGEGEG